MRYRDRVAVVTGSGNGIGREYALAFAREGAAVVIADIDEAGAKETVARVEAASGEALALRGDVSDEEAMRAMAAAAVDRFGRIDVLVNNAGLHLGEFNETTRLSLEKWRRILDVNVLGALLCARACREALGESGHGAILNQSSMAAYMAGGAYAVSKLALNGLTTSLARELAPDGIRVNGIAPGYVESPAAAGGLPDELKQVVLSGQLLRRFGAMGDLVGAVLFLCSDEASFITGQTLLVDGGSVLRP